MSAADYWVRALTRDGGVRVLAARSSATVEEARRRHATAPTATAALGRVLTATGLLAATLREQHRLTLRVNGDGPLGFLVADARGDGGVRGYVKRPEVHLPIREDGKLDVGAAVGVQGWLYVTRDLGMREPYTSSAPLVSGEIAEDMTHYFALSEQIPSLVSLGVLLSPDSSVRAAGGVFVQFLPGGDRSRAEELETNADRLESISQLIDDAWRPEDIVAQALAGFDYHVIDRGALTFQCHCNADRAYGLLASLGRQNLQEMLESQEEAELTCHFCGEQYRFGAEQLRELIAMNPSD